MFAIVTAVQKVNTALSPRYSLLLGFVATLLLWAPADAQQRTVRATPRAPSAAAYAPRFSAYLGLLRNDGGPLPNYFQFVRPQTQIQDAFRQQERALQRQRQNTQALSRQLNSIQRQQQTGVRPTGVAGGFRRYSHFFPSLR